MKTILGKALILVLASLICGAPAEAKSKRSRKSKVTKKVSSKSKKSQLGTSFSFDKASVRGKYQINGQGIATVEDEKVLDDLLGLRRNFKDREDQERARR